MCLHRALPTNVNLLDIGDPLQFICDALDKYDLFPASLSCITFRRFVLKYDQNLRKPFFKAAVTSIPRMQWALTTGLDPKDLCGAIISFDGSVEHVQWAIANGCALEGRNIEYAAMRGRLDILKLMHAAGCQWSAIVCACAAEEGHLEVVQWLHANGASWDDWHTCSWAARSGKLKVLKWLIDAGCPLDPRVWYYADHAYCKTTRKQVSLLGWLCTECCYQFNNTRTV